MDSLLFIAFAYAIGSVSSAIIVCRLMGLPDPRTEGSFNPGATNVLRIGGKKAAAITLVGDFIKGVIPVAAAIAFRQPDWAIGLAGIAAVLGHLFPVFFKFQGGKGVATAFGVTVAASWPLGLMLALTWLVVAKLFKISSLAAIVATLAAPLYAVAFRLPGSLIVMVIVISILVVWRHRTNIQRLFAGTEGKIGR